MNHAAQDNLTGQPADVAAVREAAARLAEQVAHLAARARQRRMRYDALPLAATSVA
jgi:hypothetical protein